MAKKEGPYRVSDNSGSITGSGWRVSGPGGFSVYSDANERWAQEVCRQQNVAHHAAIRAVTKMLREQAAHVLSLNGPGVPKSFQEAHKDEARTLEHAAVVCEREDMNWNNAALDAMEQAVTSYHNKPRKQDGWSAGEQMARDAAGEIQG